MSEIIDIDTGEIHNGIRGANFGPLSARLAKASADIAPVEKRGHNAHFKYDYATAEDVKHAARLALAKHGVSIFPIMADVKGANQSLRIEFDFVVSCVDGYIVIPWTYDAQGKDDKVISKCATGALKTFLIMLLQIPTGEHDPDGDGPTKSGTERQEQKQAQPATVAPLTADDVAKAKAVEFTTQSGPVKLGAFDKDKFAQVVDWTTRNGNAAARPDIIDAVDVLERNTTRISSRKRAFETIGIDHGDTLEHFENRYAAIAALSHSFVIVIDDQQHAPLWAKVYRAQRVAGGTVYEAATGADTTVLAQGEGDE